MVMEGYEMPNGWPLGLVRVTVTSQQTASPTPPPPPPPPPRPPPPLLLAYASHNLRSSSFSSFSSSNLDTESTASFFPDQSVSLGWLFGMRPTNKGGIMYREQRRTIPVDEKSDLGMPNGHDHSQGLCAPLLQHVIGRMSRNGSSFRNRQ